MKILGIAHDVWICSAAVVENGVIRSAIAEERLDRQKMSRVFPTKAIDRCLAESGISMADLDEIAVAWNPSIELETTPGGYLASRRNRSEHLLQVPARLMGIAKASWSESMSMRGAFEGSPPITYVSHYMAHVGASYFMSPYEEAAILVMDGRGEKRTTMFGSARGVEVKSLQTVDYPNSLGLFYGSVTEFLGFRPDADEWKVMALAAFAPPESSYVEALSRMITFREDGTFNLALEFFNFYNQSSNRMFSELFVEVFGPPRAQGAPIEARHMALAASAQLVFEQVATRLLNILYEQSGMNRVALSGGCFMNSVFNGKITELTPFAEAFISSCPDDSGTSVGAALYLEALRSGQKPQPPVDNYWGPEYSDEECLRIARQYALPGADPVENPSEHAATDLASGRIVGWFQGRMEFGQRALGNRSMLLDPRRQDGKDVINSAVKFREGFRPFAPAILAERVADYFECPSSTRVPFMEKVLPFKSDRIAQVPAVVHVDGTGRLQTVDEATNPRFAQLIRSFESQTGVPLVLNTSFNLNGEPIVCSPTDAIRTFYSSGLDILYLGNVRIAK